MSSIKFSLLVTGESEDIIQVVGLSSFLWKYW